MFEVVVQSGMKLAVPVPVTSPDTGVSVDAAVDPMKVDAGAAEPIPGAASTNAEGGNPPIVAASPAFIA